jgi:hypothetical protein
MRAALSAYLKAIGATTEFPERVTFAGIRAAREPASPRGQAERTFRAMCAELGGHLADHAGPSAAPRPGTLDVGAGNEAKRPTDAGG